MSSGSDPLKESKTKSEAAQLEDGSQHDLYFPTKSGCFERQTKPNADEGQIETHTGKKKTVFQQRNSENHSHQHWLFCLFVVVLICLIFKRENTL